MHDSPVPNFCTYPPAGRSQSVDGSPAVWRMKVTALSPGGNTKLVTCVNCNYDGTVVGAISYSVTQGRVHTVNDLIWVFQPGGGTGQTLSTRNVWLMEIVVWFDVRYNKAVTPPRWEKTFTHNPEDADWIDITDGTPCGG